MNKNGDQLLFNKLESFCCIWHEYSSEIDSIMRCIDFMLDRLRAIVFPTPENNLRAVSKPSPSELSESIAESLDKMSSLKNALENILSSIIDECNNRKVKCPKCSGVGYIKHYIIVRDEEFIGEDYQDLPCDYCSGHGFLDVTKNFSEQALLILNSFKVTRR